MFDLLIRLELLHSFYFQTSIFVLEKTRQLDIDHRNLISLTGSPGANDNDKKSWYQSSNEVSLLVLMRPRMIQ